MYPTKLITSILTIAIALSYSHVVACTSKGYVRVYTTQGTPVRLYRQKHMPVVTCASWKNYVMVVGNGGAMGDGTPPSQSEC
jgi:chromosome transmission fidelity protein 4